MAIFAHHLVWTTYGTWLPNDPRGSMSRETRTPALAELGAAHYGRSRIQPSRGTVREFYATAVPKLQYPVVRFNSAQIQELGQAFATIIAKHQYTCYACAIMPDHAHFVIRKHRDTGETMIENLQRDSRLRFSFAYALASEQPLWTIGGWVRYLDSVAAVRSRIKYVEGNPEKEGLRRQIWPFVVPYDGWPFQRAAPSRKLNRKR